MGANKVGQAGFAIINFHRDERLESEIHPQSGPPDRIRFSAVFLLEDFIKKVCSLCKKNKPLSDFNKRKTTADGYYGSCKECRAAYSKQRYERKRTDILIQKEGYFRENKEKIAKKKKTPVARERHRKEQKLYVQANREKAKAHNKVIYAIKKEKLPRPGTCFCRQCGCQATEYHHKSYEPEHWLDVTPLCHSCHMKIHVGVRND